MTSVTVCSPRNRAPASIARRACASLDADGLGEAVGRDVVAAEHDRRGRAAATAAHASRRGRGRGPRCPTPAAQPWRRRSSRSRSGVSAISRPPTWLEAPLPVELERAELLDGVAGELGHRLRAVGLEDEPGGVRGRAAGGEQRPWSSTVTSVQPRMASSSASEHPTMPAPMIDDPWPSAHGISRLARKRRCRRPGGTPASRSDLGLGGRASRPARRSGWRRSTSWRRPRRTSSCW